MKPTLEDYHKKYPARSGDAVERFERYEAFCKKHPQSQFGSYFAWYADLAKWMEQHNENRKAKAT